VKRKTSNFTPFLLCILAILLAISLEVLTRKSKTLGLLERLEWITYDWRVRLTKEQVTSTDPNLGYVVISDDSIKEVASGNLGYQYGLYWPRRIYGDLVEELRFQGAKIVGFDILFNTLRPDHPLVELPQGGALKSDFYFAERLKESGNVILASEVGSVPEELFRENALGMGEIGTRIEDDGVLRRALPFRATKIWHSELRKTFHRDLLDSARITKTNITVVWPEGSFGEEKGTEVTIPLDEEGLFSFPDYDPGQKKDVVISAQPFQEIRVWHLGIVLAAQHLNIDLNQSQIEPRRITLFGPSSLKRTIPLDSDGMFLIDWKFSANDFDKILIEPIEHLLWKRKKRLETAESTNVVSQQMRSNFANSWSNKVVIVGSITTGNDLTDRGATPLDKETYAASKYANVAQAVITDRFLTRAGDPWAGLAIALAGIVAGFSSLQKRVTVGFCFIVAACIFYSLTCVILFQTHKLWIPMVIPLTVSLWGTYILITSYRVIFEQKEKRHVEGIFSRVVSPHVVKELLDQEKISLGGARRKITVYFADVRGFTELTDLRHTKTQNFVLQNQLPPVEAEKYYDAEAADTLHHVNCYLATISDIVKKHNGTLDKYIGDCVMAFWGAPSHNDNHAVDAVRAAVEAQTAILRMNQERFLENEKRKAANLAQTDNSQPPLEMLPMLSLGTGINSGESIVGLMGSDDHVFNYTVFGREVNLASRLESASGRGRILIGETTFMDIRSRDQELAEMCIELPPMLVKGFSKSVRVFEVLWNKKPAAEKAAKPSLTSAQGGISV